MKRSALEHRGEVLVARSDLQRARLAVALAPWRSRVDRVDRATGWLERRAGWLGFAAGATVGLLVAVRPRLLFYSARAAAAAWPLWRLALARSRHRAPGSAVPSVKRAPCQHRIGARSGALNPGDRIE